MCLLFLLREIFGYVSTPTPLYDVCERKRERERSGYVSAPTPVSVVTEIERFGYMSVATHMTSQIRHKYNH